MTHLEHNIHVGEYPSPVEPSPPECNLRMEDVPRRAFSMTVSRLKRTHGCAPRWCPPDVRVGPRITLASHAQSVGEKGEAVSHETSPSVRCSSAGCGVSARCAQRASTMSVPVGSASTAGGGVSRRRARMLRERKALAAARAASRWATYDSVFVASS